MGNEPAWMNKERDHIFAQFDSGKPLKPSFTPACTKATFGRGGIMLHTRMESPKSPNRRRESLIRKP